MNVIIHPDRLEVRAHLTKAHQLALMLGLFEGHAQGRFLMTEILRVAMQDFARPVQYFEPLYASLQQRIRSPHLFPRIEPVMAMMSLDDLVDRPAGIVLDWLCDELLGDEES